MDTPKESEPGTSDQANCGHFDTAAADVGLKMDSGTLARIDTGGVAGAELPLDDSGECPQLDASLPPPPERSPPPLLPNDEDDGELGTVDDLLKIKNTGFFLEQPVLNNEIGGSLLASISLDGTAQQSTNRSSSFDVGVNRAQAFRGPKETEEEVSGVLRKSSIDVFPENTPPEETIQTKSPDAVQLAGNNTTANLKRTFESAGMYTIASPYAPSSLVGPSARPSPGASNLYGRVRNPSANSGCGGGLALLRAGGYGRPEYNQAGSGGSERELPQARGSLLAIYDTALGKDKTQRWSLAGTAPEVALLRLKLENVERELKELRGKHETTMNDYQAILHQLEICRAAKCRQDVDLSNVSAELTQTKAEFETSCQQRMAMERQIAEWRFKLQSKQIELEDLRQQTREMSRQPGELASKLMEEYEELRMERDNLREQCRFLDNRQSELQAALHSSESEACQMRSRYERELDEMRLKNSSLESRHVAVYQQLHRMVQERDLLRNEREMLQQQLDDACADRTRLLNFRQKKESDYEQLRQQHESAVTEYHRVMSERDSILKENERHSEEKSQLSKKLKSLESDYHSALDQLKNLELQLHTFQHQQQQQTPHKFESSREDLMSFNSSSSHSIQHTPATTVRRMLPAIPVMDANSGMAHNPFVEQRSIASSESEVALITSRAQEEELDKVRRQMDTMKEQVELTRQQLDDAKTRRDWALSERERIVAERDSMRAMCDTLRRERDEAITRLATAIRDTDELQRQKQLAERECRKLRERMELELKQRLTQAGGGNQMNGCSPSNSRDSAIDADMAEWEVETVEVNVDSGRKHADLGIELGGGRDDPTFGGTVPIYVKCLSKTSKYEGALRPYDCIVQVNNIDVTNMERRSVLDILRNSTEVKMVIRRRRLIGMKLISVTLNSAGEGDMGVDLEDGVYVNRIKTSSPAARAGNLAVGDRLVYVNDIPVHGKAASEVHELLQNCRDRSVVLAVMKSPPVMSPTTSWPGGFVNNVTNPGSGVGQLPLRTSGANVSAGHNFLQASSVCNAANRDESVQTLASSSEHLLADQNLSSSGSCLTLPRKQEKQESLLDKVHDKFFRKDKDKKSTVKAVANIAMDQPISCEHKHGSPYVRMRYIQGNSICSGPASSIGRCGTSCSPEQQVLQQLDRILEDEVPPVNKSLANVTNYEKSSGGTWPKSRGVVQPPTVSSGVSTLSQQQSKRAHSNKKPVFSVFQQPSSPLAADLSRQISKDQNMDDFVSPLVSSPLPPPHYPAPMRSHPTNPAMNRRRPGEICRPQSYHPAVPVNSNSSSSSAGAGRFGSPLPSVSVAALTAPGRKLVETLTPAAGSGGGTNSPSYHNRPPSAQSNRRRLANRPISYYEQTYADQFSIPRSTPAQVVKELHQTHFAFVTPVRQSTQSPRQPQLESANKSSSPWPPRSPTSLNQTGPLFEQLDDSSSVGSLTSPAPSLYAHSRTKTSGYNRKGYGVPSLRSPSQGDVRTIQIEKQFASEGLGIRIISHGNGVFISAVEKDSLASKHGLQVGDQLLDVCGINMRSANLQLATNVLSQLVRFGQITLTVQYDQNRYLTAAADYHHHQHSATSTPRATPNSLTDSYVKHSSTSRGHGQAQQSRETLGGEEGYVTPWSEPRFVFVKREISVWPFTLVGGNATGICVDTVKENEDSDSPGNLRCGDQVLEFDGVDFRKLTMEQAMFEMQQRPMGAEVSMLVQYNEAKYQRSKRGAGDLFYIRVNVDRQAENRDELSFRTGDILRIDNSVFNGVFGLWRAWAVDQEGRELFCGIIPSKIRLEDEIFRRSGSEISGGDGGSEGGGSRRGTIRRSLKFIRRSSRSTHQRAPSRDSKETMEPGDAVLADELYQRVERLDYKQKRPVLIVGALVDVLVAKLMEEYPNMFAHCAPECVQPTSVSILNQGLQQNIYIDYQKRDKLFEITSVAALKALMDQGFHCILRVSLSAVERLHRLQIYPVVVYVKFKDYKQIKELSEGQVNSKEAKEMCQQSAALETEYHQMFTAIIQAQHCNVKYICQRMADAVEHEQKKTLWIMSPENL